MPTIYPLFSAPVYVNNVAVSNEPNETKRVVGQALGGHQRGLQVLFVLAVLAEGGFHPPEVLTQAVGFAQGLFVVVGDSDQERGDLDRVETAKCLAKALLAKIKRADIHR